jgi:hypothetical protein
MASRDDELRRLEDEGARVALDRGADPGKLAAQLAGTQTAAMGASMAERYAALGSRWLADSAPTRLDADLVDRLARQGFRRDTLADVRIHRGTKAQAAASALGARAFAVGDQDIFFGQGEFDPHSRSGMAVLAHELAHVAPPDMPEATPGYNSAMPSSFQSSMAAPVLNERKRGDEDAAGSEAHERQAREAERRVYAAEDRGAAPSMATAPAAAAAGGAAKGKEQGKIDPQVLEAKVLSLLAKWERSEVERKGEFG